MNPRTRALLWEEFRVGGSIAAFCTGVGMFALAGLILYGKMAHGNLQDLWQFAGGEIVAVILGIPILLIPLLVLNTADSGHLTGVVPRRVLRLPVNTSYLVGISLISRMAAMFFCAGLLIAACRLIFHAGPGGRTLFLLAGIYLAAQLLAWSRGITAMAPIMLSMTAAALLTAYVGGPADWGALLTASAPIRPAFLAGFAVLAASAYILGFALVNRVRCGERFNLLDISSRDLLFRLPMQERRRDFTSPMAAQIWFELRRNGLVYPGLVVMAWGGLHLFRWLIFSNIGVFPDKGYVFFDPRWSYEWFPFIAMIGAVYVWILWTVSCYGGKRGRNHIAMIQACMTRSDLFRARLIAMTIMFSLVWVLATVLRMESILLSDRGYVGRLLAESLQHGEVGLREVLRLFLGMPLLAGILCWGILALAFSGSLDALLCAVGGVLLAMVSVGIAQGDVSGVFKSAWMFFRGGAASTIPVFSDGLYTGLWVLCWAVAFYFIGLFPARGVLSWRRGLISGRTLVSSLAVWGLLSLFFFPFSAVRSGGESSYYVLMSVGMAALILLPVVGGVAAFIPWELRRGGYSENRAQHQRKSSPAGRRYYAGILTAGVIVILVGWLCWPSEPAWKSVWRARGWPATMAAMDVWNAPASDEGNVAYDYLAVGRTCQSRINAWYKDRGGNAESLINPSLKTASTPLDNVLVAESAVCDGEPVSPEVWGLSKDYYGAVARGICDQLHAITPVSRGNSYYPAQFILSRQCGSTPLQIVTMQLLEKLSRQLLLENRVSAVEGDAKRAVDADISGLALAASLENTATLNYRYIYYSLMAKALYGCCETMNRIILPEEELARLNAVLDKEEIVHAEMPPSLSSGILEGSYMTAWGDQTHGLFPEKKEGGGACISEPFAYSLLPLIALSGEDERSRIFLLSTVRWSVHACREQWKRGYLSDEVLADVPRMSERFTRSETFSWRISAMFKSGLEHDFRQRTTINLARIAIAVERFRLAYGALPEKLGELVPQFIEAVPADPYNQGAPLTYRVNSEGSFTVYSYGPNLKDDQGGAFAKMSEGDISFMVRAPKMRSGGVETS